MPQPFGNLDLLRHIAQGERGEVFVAQRAVDARASTGNISATGAGSRRLRVVKLLPGLASGNPDLVVALQGEARRLVRRIHGNVIQIWDVGEFADRLFFVTELVEGRDVGTLLEALAAQNVTVPPDVAVSVAIEVAAGAAYVRRSHERTGAHDMAPLGLSPHAVLLSVDGDVKMLHYGSTMSAALAPRPGRALPPERASFVAPELQTRAVGTPAGDVFAVAALLWEMLTGRALGTENPVRALANVPGPLNGLLAAALADKPSQRPRDVDELRAALAPMLRALGGGGAARLGGVVRQVFGADVEAERAELAELSRKADGLRVRRGGTTPGPVTLANLERESRGNRIAVPVGGDLSPGQVIPGTRYRALSKLGEGGMGTVYAAEHVDLEKRVALKLLQAEMSRSPDMLQQFRQEARAASKIGNPFICDVTDFGELLDGRVFFVMEYLEGRSLGRVLRSEGRLEPARALAVLRQVAKALGAAHDKGIVHLDVKPDNVMLVEQRGRADAVKVVDFGIAGLLGQTGDQDRVAGTPEYIAPERATGRGYDHRSDVYSMGAMAYEMLTGLVPFQGKDVIATMTMHVKDPPEPMRRRVPGVKVPPALEAVVLHMLEKDPAARPQSMAEVEAELCEAQIAEDMRTGWDDLDLPAVEAGRREHIADRMPSPGRGKRLLVVAAAVLVALAGVGVGVLAWTRKPQVQTVTMRTGEDPAVLALLEKAARAHRDGKYVSPPGESALDFIVGAESKAELLKTPSKQAENLRISFASGFKTAGDALDRGGLRTLAIEQWRLALRFQPDDPELQAKAELTPEEKTAVVKRARTAPAALRERPADDAKEAAARLFLRATQGRLSEARLALKSLVELDRAHVQSASVADALRRLAAKEWASGRYEAAHPLYDLVAGLDPADAEARERAKPGSRSELLDPMTGAPPPGTGSPGRGKRRGGGDGAGFDIPADTMRDQAASKKAAAAGEAALTRGRLAEAESAFAKAVRADPFNAVAVGGLAGVYFERAKYSEAMDYARRATRLAPKTPRYFVLMGDAYFKQLRWDDALKAYQQAQVLAPRDTGVRDRIKQVSEKLRGP